jgi:hypothetical protein
VVTISFTVDGALDVAVNSVHVHSHSQDMMRSSLKQNKKQHNNAPRCHDYHKRCIRFECRSVGFQYAGSAWKCIELHRYLHQLKFDQSENMGKDNK